METCGCDVSHRLTEQPYRSLVSILFHNDVVIKELPEHAGFLSTPLDAYEPPQTPFDAGDHSGLHFITASPVYPVVSTYLMRPGDIPKNLSPLIPYGYKSLVEFRWMASFTEGVSNSEASCEPIPTEFRGRGSETPFWVFYDHRLDRHRYILEDFKYTDLDSAQARAQSWSQQHRIKACVGHLVWMHWWH